MCREARENGSLHCWLPSARQNRQRLPRVAPSRSEGLTILVTLLYNVGYLSPLVRCVCLPAVVEGMVSYYQQRGKAEGKSWVRNSDWRLIQAKGVTPVYSPVLSLCFCDSTLLFSLRFIYFIFIMHECCVCMYLCAPPVCIAHRDQKWMSDPVGIELQADMNYHRELVTELWSSEAPASAPHH